jgi:hypothetical protein
MEEHGRGEQSSTHRHFVMERVVHSNVEAGESVEAAHVKQESRAVSAVVGVVVPHEQEGMNHLMQ